MPNAVGSFETKHWHKKWIEIKKKIVLTETQKSLIIGSLLGDGTMRIGKGAKNANFKVEHGLEQRKYVEWKYGILRPLVFSPPRISYRYNNKRRKYPKSWWFRTIRHPLLTELYYRFYKGNKRETRGKKIPKDIQKDLNPLVIAVWIMDDGSYSRGKIDLSTYSFSLSEIHLLQKGLKEKFNLCARYYEDRDRGVRMYFNQKETRKLIRLVKSYIIPSMRYKIGLVSEPRRD